jgi:hypothetical protein
MTLLLIILLVALLIPLTAVVLDSQVGRAIATRLERPTGRDLTSGSRMAALETEVERLSKEVNRLEQETTFLHQLLESRATTGELAPGEDPST